MKGRMSVIFYQIEFRSKEFLLSPSILKINVKILNFKFKNKFYNKDDTKGLLNISNI